MKDDRKLEIKSRMAEYLRSIGEDVSKPFHCVAHLDNNPSMSFYAKTNRVKCFACGWSGDIFDLIGEQYGLKDHKEIFRKAENIFGGLEMPLEAPKHTKQYQSTQSTPKPLKDYTAYFKRVQPQLRQTDYLLKRGISYETAERHAVGFDPKFKFTMNGAQIPSIILFTGQHSFTARSTLPDSKDGERVKKVGSSPLYLGGMLSKADRPLIITEGEIDALSVIEVGGSAMALGSTSNAPLFLKRVSEERPRVTLILALDNDKEGQAATERIARELTNMNVDFKVCNISGDYNDPSEALQFNRDVFTKTVKGIY